MTGFDWTSEDLERIRRYLCGEMSDAERAEIMSEIQSGEGPIAKVARRLADEDVSLISGIERLAAASPRRKASVDAQAVLFRKRVVFALSAAVAASLAVAAFLVFRPHKVTTLADGRAMLQVYADGTIRGLSDYPAVWRHAAEKAIRSGVAVPLAYQQLKDSLPVLRSGETKLSPAILSPYLTMVRSQQPELNWAALENAEKYRVELFEVGEEEPLATEESPGTNWRVPVSLQRGKTYQWCVYYVVGKETFAAPKRDEKPAVFKVLDKESLQRLLREEKELAGSQLLLGLLYVQEGLLDEAADTWAQLKRENPHSELVDRLVKGLQTLR